MSSFIYSLFLSAFWLCWFIFVGFFFGCEECENGVWQSRIVCRHHENWLYGFTSSAAWNFQLQIFMSCAFGNEWTKLLTTSLFDSFFFCLEFYGDDTNHFLILHAHRRTYARICLNEDKRKINSNLLNFESKQSYIIHTHANIFISREFFFFFDKMKMEKKPFCHAKRDRKQRQKKTFLAKHLSFVFFFSCLKFMMICRKIRKIVQSTQNEVRNRDPTNK